MTTRTVVAATQAVLIDLLYTVRTLLRRRSFVTKVPGLTPVLCGRFLDVPVWRSSLVVCETDRASLTAWQRPWVD